MAKVQRFIWVFQFLFVLLQRVWRKEAKIMNEKVYKSPKGD